MIALLLYLFRGVKYHYDKKTGIICVGGSLLFSSILLLLINIINAVLSGIALLIFQLILLAIWNYLVSVLWIELSEKNKPH